jgi:hypothetical protein
MESNTLGLAIVVVNVLILLILFKTLYHSCRKCYSKVVEDGDYNFYMLIFLVSGWLFIANLMAFYTSFVIYVYDGVKLPNEITLARYVDRVSMFFAYVGFDLLSKKYIPNWFKR